MPPNFPSPGELLPHRPPMLLICAVRAHTPGETVCDAVFDAAFARACGGEVPAAFGLELIAQAAAVHHALAQLAAGGVHVRAARGLLLGSRRLDLRVRALPVGEVLVVTVVGGGEQPGPGGLIRFEGRVETPPERSSRAATPPCSKCAPVKRPPWPETSSRRSKRLSDCKPPA